ncbi:hypothetical protein F1B71_21670 [Escherichia coli]|nr:hypothetical protein [Escherichia coli]
MSALHYSGYDNNFAWSIGAGVRYDVTPDIALDLSYRYLDAGDSSVSYKDEWSDNYAYSVIKIFIYLLQLNRNTLQ